MKIIYILPIALLFNCNSNQVNKTNIELKNDSKITESIAKNIDPTGTYILDSETEVQNGETYGYSGTIQVKKIEKKQIAITFITCKGAPSYNMGGFADTLQYVNNKAIYKGTKETPDCKIIFAFSDKGIIVTEDGANACGFGHGVYADGFFKKTSEIEPILEDPFTGKRLEKNNSIYSGINKKKSAETEKMPKVYNELFGNKLVGLTLEKKGQNRKYIIDFSTVCRCDGRLILIKKDEKRIYIYPYCSNGPSKGEYNNWEYTIKSIDYINNKLVVHGINENTTSKGLVFIFGKLDDKNVFSLEVEGDKPVGMYFDKYITPREVLFEKCDCGDYDG